MIAAEREQPDEVKLIQTVLTEIRRRRSRAATADATINFEMLPPFSEKAMKGYEDDKPSTPGRADPEGPRMLWAISTATPPESLKKDVGGDSPAARR